jgi:Flp pilus assembly protein TadD
VEPKVEEKEAAREAAADVAASPDDADARVALRRQLRKILESDGSLAAEVAKLLDEAGAGPRYHAELHGSGAIAQGRGAVAAGQGGVAVGGDVSGSVIVGGEGRNSRGEPQ